MTDIPDQPILRRVEDIMQGNGQFHGAEIGREMAAGAGDRFNQKGPQLLGQGRQPGFGQGAQV